MMDEDRKTWTQRQKENAAIAGLIAFCILFAVGLWWQDNAVSTYRPSATTSGGSASPTLRLPNTWQSGDTAVIKADVTAAQAAGHFRITGTACRMFAGAIGTVTEIGGALGDTGLNYVDVDTPGCSGWVCRSALRLP